MAVDKALAQAPRGLDALGNYPDNDPAAGAGTSASGAKPRLIVVVQGDDDEDTSEEAQTEGKVSDTQDEKFNENLAEKIVPEDKLSAMASDLIADFDDDIASRKEWVNTYVDGLELLGMKIEERSEPWEGACGVYHPHRRRPREQAHLGGVQPARHGDRLGNPAQRPAGQCRRPLSSRVASSPEADWLEYLPQDYYPNLMQGKSQDWIDVYVHAKFGKSLAGLPVYRTFRSDFHIAKQRLNPIRMTDRPLIIGMDFGLNPSATINQLDLRGRFLTYDALTSDNMGVQRFLENKLKPLLASKFPGFPVIVVGDPAGQARAQTDERTCFEMVRADAASRPSPPAPT